MSDEIKARFPDVAWQQPVRLRNRIVHGYWSIDLGVLHTTASEQLPDFTGELRTVLKTLPNAPDSVSSAARVESGSTLASGTSAFVTPRGGQDPA